VGAALFVIPQFESRTRDSAPTCRHSRSGHQHLEFLQHNGIFMAIRSAGPYTPSSISEALQAMREFLDRLSLKIPLSGHPNKAPSTLCATLRRCLRRRPLVEALNSCRRATGNIVYEKRS